MSDFDKGGKLSDETVFFDVPRDVFGSLMEKVKPTSETLMLDEGYVMLDAMKDKWNK